MQKFKTILISVHGNMALKDCLKYDRERETRDKKFTKCSVESIFLQERNHWVTKSQTQVSIHVRKDNIIRSDQISRSVVSDSLRPHESQHARPPCPSPTPGVHSDSRPSSQ